MKNYVVVNDARRWLEPIEGAEIVEAETYLTNPLYATSTARHVYNLCDSYLYQRLGYYVSLLAEARGHKPIPTARTIEDLQSPNLVRLLTETLEELVQHTLDDSHPATVEWDFYFGLRAGQTEDILGQRLFQLLKTPLLRARFEQHGNRWQISNARALAIGELDTESIRTIYCAARRFFLTRNGRNNKHITPCYEIAILHDAAIETHPPSNPLALQKFAEAANILGMHTELINRADYGRLSEFDGLFIRDTTRVNHYTYRFARQAAAQGLVVIDDPDSILKCSNKVYLAELLAQRSIPAPKTLVVHRGNINKVFSTLGAPCIVKQPDSAFSAGVAKVSTQAELESQAKAFIALTDLFIAQEYLPTDFDWRVGIFNRRVLFVAKYFMAPGHWQIIKRDAEKRLEEGTTMALHINEVPNEVMQQALRAANAIGDGLYGVDIKQTNGYCYVIEVNDNPNLDAGNEDGVLRDALYREVMSVFLKRIEARKRVIT